MARAKSVKRLQRFLKNTSHLRSFMMAILISLIVTRTYAQRIGGNQLISVSGGNSTSEQGTVITERLVSLTRW